MCIRDSAGTGQRECGRLRHGQRLLQSGRADHNHLQRIRAEPASDVGSPDGIAALGFVFVITRNFCVITNAKNWGWGQQQPAVAVGLRVTDVI